MADLTAIRVGIATNVSSISDLNVSPSRLSNPQLPCVVVFAGPTEYDKAFGRGLDTLVFMVRVAVPATTDTGAVVSLDPYLAGSGPRSIKEAIESDKTLGGACSDLRVTGHKGEQPYNVEGQPPALGAEFRVEVTAHG
jgi:hypothetical protein